MGVLQMRSYMVDPIMMQLAGLQPIAVAYRGGHIVSL